MHAVIEKVEEWWCQWAHEGSMWPIHGQYRCAQCYRIYGVDWDAAGAGRVMHAAANQPS